MRVYLDTCCYNRPFDDLRQPRIKMESEAVLGILQYANIIIIGSDVLEEEIGHVLPNEKRADVLALYGYCHERVSISEALIARSKEFSRVQPYDALHLACAEYGNARVLLTTDDRFIKAAKSTDSIVRVINPVQWMMEVQAWKTE